MKHKLLSIFLCLLLALPLSSCKEFNDSKGSEQSESPKTTAATTTVTTPPSSEQHPETKPDPLLDKKNTIKDQVIVFMADDVENNDPYAMF